MEVNGRGGAGPLREWGGTGRRDRVAVEPGRIQAGLLRLVARPTTQPHRVVAQAEDDPVPVRAAPGARADLAVDDERLQPAHHHPGHLMARRHPQRRRQEVGHRHFLCGRGRWSRLEAAGPRLGGLQPPEQLVARTLGFTERTVLAYASKEHDFLLLCHRAGAWNTPHTSDLLPLGRSATSRTTADPLGAGAVSRGG